MAASLRSALPWPVARARFSAEPRVQVELRWILNSDLRYVFGGSSKMDGTSTWHFDVEHKSFPYVRGLVAPTPGFAVFFPVELDDVVLCGEFFPWHESKSKGGAFSIELQRRLPLF